MPSSFTPQQIEDFLQEFFDVVGARQYIGARYVPIFGRAGEDTVEWDDGAPYEPLTVVMHQGVSYVSRRYVPTGIGITDTEYWVETYRFNAQVEQYRQQVLSFQDQIDDRVPFPVPPESRLGTVGQVLGTLGDGGTAWVDPVTVTSEIAEPLIEDWLDAHPEATTTVQDGAVTTDKLANGAVTTQKLARGAVTGDKLETLGVPSDLYHLAYKILRTIGYENDNLYEPVLAIDGTNVGRGRCDVAIDGYTVTLSCTDAGSMYFGGAIAEGASWQASAGVPASVTPGDVVFVRLSNDQFTANRATFYDSGLTCLSYTDFSGDTNLTVPEGAAFVTFRIGRTGALGSSYTTTVEAYVDRTETVKAQLEALDSGIDAINAVMRTDTLTPWVTFLGYGALRNLTTGVRNLAIGYMALAALTTGGYNTAFGAVSGAILETGGSNTLIGNYSGTVAADTSESVTVGTNATAGSRSTAIGKDAKATHYNAMALGWGVETTADNEYAYGRPSNTHRFAGPISSVAGSFVATDNRTKYTSDVGPALDQWTGSGAASYADGKWTLGEGDTISCTVSLSSDHAYEIAMTHGTVKTQGDYVYPLTVSVGSESLDIFAANDGNFTVVMTPAASGNATIQIGGSQWWGTITGVTINRINSYPVNVLTANEYGINTYQTNISVGNGHPEISTHTARGNVALGQNCQVDTESGYYNVAIGSNCQQHLRQGCYNTAIGIATQQNLVTGMYNHAIGSFAHSQLVSGCWNVAIGNEAQRDLIDGCNNVTIGRRAGNSMVHANANTFMGSLAGFGRSDLTGDGTISDANATIDACWQTLLGWQSTQSSGTRSDYLTAVGARAEGAQHATAIGAGASAAGIGSVAIGRDSSGNAAQATQANDFVLGTSNHRFVMGDKVIVFNLDGTVTWEALA